MENYGTYVENKWKNLFVFVENYELWDSDWRYGNMWNMWSKMKGYDGSIWKVMRKCIQTHNAG